MIMAKTLELGVGFFINNNGIGITAAHVLQDSDVWSVYINKGKRLAASPLVKSEWLDLALIKVEGAAPGYVELGNSDQVIVGSKIVHLGPSLKNKVSKLKLLMS